MVQGAFPEKCDLPPWNAQAIRLETTEVDGVPHASLHVSPYMYPVYRSVVLCYQTLSRLGYHLIVDEVLFDPHRIAPYFELLTEETVYFVGVKPDKAVVMQREQARGDRIPGLAAGLYAEVYHPLFQYDLLVDTGQLNPEESADAILQYLAAEKNPSGFRVSAEHWQSTQTARG